MGDGRFDQVEMAVVLAGVGQFMKVEILQVFLALEPFLSRPAFTNLLQQDVPLRLVAVAARRFSAIVTEGIVGGGPPFEVPLSWLAVGSADLASVLFQQSADGDMTVHRP